VSDACRVIDSRDATPREGGPHKLLEGDGYHRTKKGGELWADGILEDVRESGGDQNVAPRQSVPRAEAGRS
jgi:hypothetical protein